MRKSSLIEIFALCSRLCQCFALLSFVLFFYAYWFWGAFSQPQFTIAFCLHYLKIGSARNLHHLSSASGYRSMKAPAPWSRTMHLIFLSSLQAQDAAAFGRTLSVSAFCFGLFPSLSRSCIPLLASPRSPFPKSRLHTNPYLRMCFWGAQPRMELFSYSFTGQTSLGAWKWDLG